MPGSQLAMDPPPSHVTALRTEASPPLLRASRLAHEAPVPRGGGRNDYPLRLEIRVSWRKWQPSGSRLAGLDAGDSTNQPLIQQSFGKVFPSSGDLPFPGLVDQYIASQPQRHLRHDAKSTMSVVVFRHYPGHSPGLTGISRQKLLLTVINTHYSVLAVIIHH